MPGPALPLRHAHTALFESLSIMREDDGTTLLSGHIKDRATLASVLRHGFLGGASAQCAAASEHLLSEG